MELADAGVLVLGQQVFHVPKDGFVPDPRADVAARPVRPELGDDQIRRFGEQLLRSRIVGARDEGPLEAGLAENRYRFLGRHHRDRVVAVVDVGVEDRELGRVHDAAAERQQQERERRSHPHDLAGQ
jgi:hypothetical protein